MEFFYHQYLTVNLYNHKLFANKKPKRLPRCPSKGILPWCQFDGTKLEAFCYM